jgi:hypothetical protein
MSPAAVTDSVAVMTAKEDALPHAAPMDGRGFKEESDLEHSSTASDPGSIVATQKHPSILLNKCSFIVVCEFCER